MNRQSLNQFIELITFDQQTHDIQKKIQTVENNILQFQKEIGQEEHKKVQAESKEQELQKQIQQQDVILQEFQDKEQNLLKNIEKISASREYDAGLKELEYLRTARSSEEQKLMQLHNKIKNIRKETASTVQEVQDQVTQLKSNIESENQNLNMLHQQLSTLSSTRQEKIKDISSDWLEIYEMMQGRVANPVAPLEQDSCSVCFYGLTPRDLQILRQNGIIQCKDCYRILYEPSAS